MINCELDLCLTSIHPLEEVQEFDATVINMITLAETIKNKNHLKLF